MKFLERFFRNKGSEEKMAGLGRNDACWCGSGKKYKRCHLEPDEHKRRMKGDLRRKTV